MKLVFATLLASAGAFCNSEQECDELTTCELSLSAYETGSVAVECNFPDIKYGCCNAMQIDVHCQDDADCMQTYVQNNWPQNEQNWAAMQAGDFDDICPGVAALDDDIDDYVAAYCTTTADNLKAVHKALKKKVRNSQLAVAVAAHPVAARPVELLGHQVSSCPSGAPSGSWYLSCSGASYTQESGYCVLHASCTRADGYTQVQNNVGYMGCDSVANIDGQLRCDDGHFVSSCPSSQPSGSWARSCSSVSYNGNSGYCVATTSCTRIDGSQMSQSIGYTGCADEGLANIDGQLTCQSDVDFYDFLVEKTSAVNKMAGFGAIVGLSAVVGVAARLWKGKKTEGTEPLLADEVVA